MRETLPRASHPNVALSARLLALLAPLGDETRDALAPLHKRLTTPNSAFPARDPVLTAHIFPAQRAALVRALLADEGTHFTDLFADWYTPTAKRDAAGGVPRVEIHLVLALDQGRGWVQLVTELPPDSARIESLVEALAAVDWYERELWDEAGIKPTGHPYPRRLRLPASWPENTYPMRRTPDELITVTSDQTMETAEARVPLLGLDDEREELDPGPAGVVDYPLGPVRSGVVESGHYTLRTIGEEIVDFRLQLFYKHRGIEQRALGLGPLHLPLVAERISGTSGFAHALATCEALERAANLAVPDRARYLRTFYAELERLYNHLGYQADLCQATGLVVGQAQFDLLKERVLRLNGRLTGHRYLFGTCVYGGVMADLTPTQLAEAQTVLANVRQKVRVLGPMLFASPSHVDRLENTGILTPADARAWAAVGPVARASGVDRDLRRDAPYAAYRELAFDVPVRSEGDALARARIRLDEATQTLRLLEQVIEKLPGGPSRIVPEELPRDIAAFGWVESPRGEGLHWVRLDGAGKVARYRVRTASFANAQAFPLCVPGRNILTDFPIIEQSWALSYAGADR